jgi:hypothetical protein
MSLERQIAREIRLERYRQETSGEGMYLFQNNTKGDLFLPRPTQSGRKMVRRGEQFVGDNYYFNMLRSNELKLIKELASPEALRESENTNKLLTEQPPTITNEGTVEYIQPPSHPINENRGQADVLLTETPLDGIKIIR